MAVVRREVGDQHEVVVPTDANRDLGLFLIFLGVVGTLPMRYFLTFWGFGGFKAFYVAISGVILVLGGFFFLAFSRKRYTVTARDLSMTDGFFHKTLRYVWESVPAIQLHSQEEEKGQKDVEYWLVSLVDGKRHYVLDRRAGHQMESRALAEALAKSINCPVNEKGTHGDIVIPREELDLPFTERVRRNPSLLGPELPKPETSTTHHWEKDGQLGFSWRLAGSATLNEFILVTMLLTLLALVPLLPGRGSADQGQSGQPLQRSFLDLARQDHDFKYFLGVGSFLGVMWFVLFGYKKRLLATREALDVRDSLWGIPVRSTRIPVDKLEEIWVRQSSGGTTIQLISDDCMISGRTASFETASWVASKIGHYYMKG